MDVLKWKVSYNIRKITSMKTFRAEFQPGTASLGMIDEVVSGMESAEGAVRYMTAKFNSCARLPPVPNLSTVG